MTAAEMVRRYHVAEKRLAEVEALIEAHAAYDAWAKERWDERRWESRPIPPGDLAALYLERDRLQAESFRVFIESRREA